MRVPIRKITIWAFLRWVTWPNTSIKNSIVDYLVWVVIKPIGAYNSNEEASNYLSFPFFKLNTSKFIFIGTDMNIFWKVMSTRGIRRYLFPTIAPREKVLSSI